MKGLGRSRLLGIQIECQEKVESAGPGVQG